MKKKSIDHTQLLLLKLLAGEDMYGYQMIEELARRSDDTFTLKAGTLYPMLHDLEKAGLITSGSGDLRNTAKFSCDIHFCGGF